MLLMQMGSEHLQAAHAGALEPSLQLDVRQQLAQAYKHYCMEVPPAADGALGSSSSAQGRPMQVQEQRGEPACQHLAAALQACGISLPCKVAGTTPAAADSSRSSSSAWQGASTSSPGGAGAAVAKAAVTIPAPGAAADNELRASGEGASRVSVSSGVLGSAASDMEAPVVGHRPVSPLPASPAATPERTPASAATTPPASSMSTPFGVSPRAGTSSPKAPTSRVKEGYGSYAKLLNRQATNSLGNSPGAAAALAAAAADVFASSAGRVSDAEGGEAAAAQPTELAVQGGCLVDQGAMQWAPVHSGEVVAMAAQNRVAVSAGLDGDLKVCGIKKHRVHALVRYCCSKAMRQCECWARPC